MYKALKAQVKGLQGETNALNKQLKALNKVNRALNMLSRGTAYIADHRDRNLSAEILHELIYPVFLSTNRHLG